MQHVKPEETTLFLPVSTNRFAMKTLVFNHFYKLRHDLKRTLLIGPANTGNVNRNSINPGWISKIHPFYAMLFSFFSAPIEEEEVYSRISYFLEKTTEEVKTLLQPFVENQQPVHTEYAGIPQAFPKNLIIDIKQATCQPVIYQLQDFKYQELDFKRQRYFSAPVGLVFMVNNTCMTDCLYCYADKSYKVKNIAFSRLEEIIKEASSLGVQSFQIVGGEFFLYKHWKKLLQVLNHYNYLPQLISTKVPLDEQTLCEFKPFGVQIQVSLDSLNPEKLSSILNVKNNYAEKIKHSIYLLAKHQIPFQVATVLTNRNEDLDNLKEIYAFLTRFHVIRWEIRGAFRSLYTREDFSKIRPSKEALDQIGTWIGKIKDQSPFPFMWVPDNGRQYRKNTKGSRSFEGSRCSANFSHMVILPDGQVTICEQLYWLPQFLIGDLNRQTIREVWNSPRALALAAPRRSDFSDRSACKTCELLDDCIEFPNKCYADVLKGYGKENSDFPDPRCIHAPEFYNEL